MESFGTDGAPGSLTDFDLTDAIALYGHNMASTQTVIWMRVLDRLAGPNRPKLLVVDPRRTVPAQARGRPPRARSPARTWRSSTGCSTR